MGYIHNTLGLQLHNQLRIMLMEKAHICPHWLLPMLVVKGGGVVY